jgi:enamine deaminase RidA (YjgF/YER057c/UK114 family)
MRKLISSGTETERLAAYSRAVVEAGWIFVSGTVGLDPESGTYPDGPGAQAALAFSSIERALSEAGAGLADVVRCRVYVVSREHVPAVAAVLRQKFSSIRPANTTVICQLPHPQALVEIEVTARVPGAPEGNAEL